MRPLIQGSTIRNLASADRDIRERAAETITVRVHEATHGALDPSDCLRLVLEEEWEGISLEDREALVNQLVQTVVEEQRPPVRQIAAAALATLGAHGITSLLDQLDHPDPTVRSTVAISVGLLNKSAKSALPLLLHAATLEHDPVVRGDLVRVMSRIDDPELFPSLIELLTLMDGTPDAKMLGAQVLAAIRDRRRREWPEANK